MRNNIQRKGPSKAAIAFASKQLELENKRDPTLDELLGLARTLDAYVEARLKALADELDKSLVRGPPRHRALEPAAFQVAATYLRHGRFEG